MNEKRISITKLVVLTLVVFCLIPALGIREAHAASKIYTVTLSDTSGYTILIGNSTCPVSPTPDFNYSVDLPSAITASSNTTGIVRCGGNASITISANAINYQLTFTLTMDEIDRGNGNIIVPNLGGIDFSGREIRIYVTPTLIKTATSWLEPKTLPEDSIGAYIEGSEPREYAWFFTAEECKKFMPDPEMCVWPRVMQ